MIGLIREHILAGSKKNKTAPYIFLVMFIYAIIIVAQAVVFYGTGTILIRAGACIGILAAFAAFERSSLSVTAVAFLSPLSIIVLIAFATFDGNGALLIFLHIIAAAMISFTYMKPKAVALFVAAVSIAAFSLLAVFNINILGEHYTMIQNYLYLAITSALNILLYFFCKSHSDTIEELVATKNEASKASEIKGIFLSNMSHEIRTPITVVLGVSEIELQRQNIPPETEDSFSRIHNSAKLLLRLINDILDFSKMEDNKMSIQNDEYEITGLISTIAHPYYAHLQGKDIRFNLNVEENLPALLMGDVLRIEQVMMNLLSNAFNYTDKGTVDLSVGFEPCKDDRSEYITLVLSVRDTGIGMTEEQLNTIFGEYTRFHEHLNTDVNGTGLGMAIVQRLIILMDGHIKLESEVNKGTTATVYIPQKISGTETLSKEAVFHLQQFEMLNSSNQKIKLEPMPYGSVLIVDDVDTNLHVAKGLLDLYSLNVETCSDGWSAIDKVKAKLNIGKAYDIVFMDYMMPEINGIETMQILREMGYTHPIVVLTANALTGLREEYIEKGFDGFLSKPIITSELNKVLVKYVMDKQPPDVIEAAKKLKPINQKAIDEFQDSGDLLNKIRADFVKERKNIISDIEHSISIGDTDTAHRLAHTLKGLAATMKEPALSKAAQDAEDILENEEALGSDKLLVLKQELKQVLEKFEALLPEQNNQAKQDKQTMENSEIIELLNNVKPLLEHRKAQCLDFADELRTIPEAAILARQIEKMDFPSALKSLNVLLDILK